MSFFRFSVFYFFYFAVLGLVAPYLGLYLAAQHFSLLEIGQLTSLFLLTKIVAPNIWGALADHYQCRLVLVRAGTLATLCGYLFFFVAEGFWQTAFTIIVFSFFWNAVLPQFEVITLHNLADQRHRYSQIRLWGSVGFIASVAGAGLLIEQLGIAVFPWLLLSVLVALSISALPMFSEPVTLQRPEQSHSFLTELKRQPILLFLAACFFLQLSHGAYYTYFSLFLSQHDYSETQIGLLWAIGVLAEVLLFMVMHRWLAAHALKAIMLVALMATVLRWIATVWFVDYGWLLVLVQCGHALSFGAMHACSIQFVHAHFSALHQGKAQALYSSIGFGAGGALGAFLSGLVVSGYGYIEAFYLSAFFAFFAFLSILRQRTASA